MLEQNYMVVYDCNKDQVHFPHTANQQLNL